MRTRIILSAFFVLAMFCSASAQQKKAGNKIRFGSQNYAGILEGESGTSFQIQTINGIRYKTWFAGVGTGVDYYYERSIPLFLSVSKFLSSPTVPLYFNGDAGINFPWHKGSMYDLHYSGGLSSSFFWSGGLGYKFGLGKNDHGILLNFGFSYKHLIGESEFVSPCLIPPCPVEKERYDYNLKRLSVKVGWMF